MVATARATRVVLRMVRLDSRGIPVNRAWIFALGPLGPFTRPTQLLRAEGMLGSTEMAVIKRCPRRERRRPPVDMKRRGGSRGVDGRRAGTRADARTSARGECVCTGTWGWVVEAGATGGTMVIRHSRGANGRIATTVVGHGKYMS